MRATPLFVAAAVLVTAAIKPARAEEAPTPATPAGSSEAAREDDMFGGDAKPGESAAREDDMFGGDAKAEGPAKPAEGASTGVSELDGDNSARLMQTLIEKNDKLAIGGRFILQGGYAFLEDTTITREDSPLFVPTLTDVYLDSRPNDSIRFYARGRLNFSFSESSHDRLTTTTAGFLGTSNANPNAQLEQMWLKFDINKAVFVTIGKQRIRWGTGRTWNPTDFMNQARLDPLAVADFRLGANLLKVHVPVESLGWNFYALLDLQTPATTANPTASLTPAKVGGALRAELVLGPAEVTLTGYVRPVETTGFDGKIIESYSPRFGADVSMPLGPFDVRVEGALIRDPSAVYFEGDYSLAGLDTFRTDLYAIPERVDRFESFVPQVVASLEYQLQYSDQDSVIFSGEYFYNGAGYDDGRYYQFLRLAPTLAAQLDTPIPTIPGSPTLSNVLGLDASERWSLQNAGAGFNGLYYGRHYVSFGVSVPTPGPLNDSFFGSSVIGNLSDGSWRAQLTYSQTVLTNMQVAVFGQWNLGESGEFVSRVSLPGAFAGTPGTTVQLPFARAALFAFLIVNI